MCTTDSLTARYKLQVNKYDGRNMYMYQNDGDIFPNPYNLHILTRGMSSLYKQCNFKHTNSLVTGTKTLIKTINTSFVLQNLNGKMDTIISIRFVWEKYWHIITCRFLPNIFPSLNVLRAIFSWVQLVVEIFKYCLSITYFVWLLTVLHVNYNVGLETWTDVKYNVDLETWTDVECSSQCL